MREHQEVRAPEVPEVRKAVEVQVGPVAAVVEGAEAEPIRPRPGPRS